MDNPMETGFYPFWFWNDRLEAGEIRWQIREMAAQGVRGFYVHSRQGLEQPYLSEAFFAMLDVAVDEARAQGLTVHLYDEYPYPSGVAGGEVVLGSPEYQATELRQQMYEVPGGPLRLDLPRGKVLAVRAYPLRDGLVDWTGRRDLRSAVGMALVAPSYMETGLTRYNQKRYFASRPTPVLETTLPEGSWRIFASVQAEVENHKYWFNFVDPLNPQAIQAFLNLTHERYFQRYAAEFGHTIRSIFTDETHPGWSARLPQAFQEAYGYDLLDHLEALQDPSYPNAVRVAADRYRLLYQMFVEAYDRPISEWCRAHGIAYCGEKPSLRLSQLQYMDIPGCEPGHTKAGAPLDLLQARVRGNARATASAAYFYGKAGCLDECFHSLGWSGTLQDARFMTDAMLLLGIRYLVPHGFFYSTHALRKHDAPPTFFFQMPYWPLFGRLSQRVEIIDRHFAGTFIDARVLLIEPASGMPVDAHLAAYERMQNLMMAHQFDFMQVDTDILQAGRVENGTIYIRDVAARVVVLPAMPYVEPELAIWLDGFEQAGGHVLRCTVDFDPDLFLRELYEYAQPGLTVTPAGQAAPLWVVRRASGDKRVWLVLNTGSQAVEVEIEAGEALHEVALDEHLPPALEPVNSGRPVYCRRIAPFEGLLLESGPATANRQPLPQLSLRLAGQARISPRSPNLLRMARWQFSLLDADGLPLETSTALAMPLANQLALSKLRFAPEFVLRFGVEPEMGLPALAVRYDYVFENQFSGPVELVMEPGSIVGDWQIWVNQSGPLTAADFVSSGAHVRGSLGAPVGAALLSGTNLIRVEVRTAQLDGGLINPLYLAGDFGVQLTPLALTERLETGRFEDYQGNGLPFYAGVLEYTFELNLTELPTGGQVLLNLETEGPFSEALELSLNGGDFLPVLWQPRRVALAADQLRQGLNQVVARVSTTLIRSFEGQWFDDTAHTYRTI